MCILFQKYCILIWCSLKSNRYSIQIIILFFLKSDTVWCIRIFGPTVFECNPLLEISLRQGEEIMLSFAVLKTIIFLKELVPSSYEAVMGDFIISKKLESKPLGIITCTQTVHPWAKSWQWQLHWRMCLLHPFYKNNTTHPEVVLNTLFQANIFHVPPLTAPEYENWYLQKSWSSSGHSLDRKSVV